MIRIALYGKNGHQLPPKLPAQVRARVVAVAEYPAEWLDANFGADSPERRAIVEYGTLEELLANPDIDLVSLCSPRRVEQAEQAMLCLRAGKHVLAEKPGAFSDEELDRLLETVRQTGREFHEMNDSMLEPAIRSIRHLVDRGDLGTIVHVQAHKSYPWHDRRPQDMETDGGLTRQVGIHAMRFVIASTGQRITSVMGNATNLGNPGDGDIQIATTFSCTLESGGVASVNLNYLNPKNFGVWGNDQVRVFGAKGMAESVDGFQRNRLYLEGRENIDLPIQEPHASTSYIEHYANHLLDGIPMPISLDEAQAALRATIAAQEAVDRGERVPVR